jgi:hypothetical protein
MSLLYSVNMYSNEIAESMSALKTMKFSGDLLTVVE